MPSSTRFFQSLGSPTTLTAVLLALGVAYACDSEEDGGSNDPTAAGTEALTSIAACVTTSTSSLVDAVALLNDALDDLAAAPEDDAAVGAAQTAWQDVQDLWQVAEFYQFGPAGRSGEYDKGGALGGQDIRDKVYSWPLVNACRVDQNLVRESYLDGLSEASVNSRGLDVIEYLIFPPSDESSCGPIADIIVEGTWDELENLPERRALYAQAAGVDLKNSIDELQTAWSADGGNFEAEFTQAGDLTVYETQAEAFDAVVSAALYIDTLIKDQKIGLPIGRSELCASATCPEDFEHQFAKTSRNAIQNNLDGFSNLVTGCGEEEGGLVVLLKDIGAGALATSLQEQGSVVKDAVEALEDDNLIDVLADDPDSLNSLHDELRTLSTLLKVDVVDALGINLGSGGGDND
ncbi:MAG: imelysin family protein [Polyangiaceae bacterium]|nr:imelysin family protein [Polyangiaceae bacterium]